MPFIGLTPTSNDCQCSIYHSSGVYPPPLHGRVASHTPSVLAVSPLLISHEDCHQVPVWKQSSDHVTSLCEAFTQSALPEEKLQIFRLPLSSLWPNQSYCPGTWYSIFTTSPMLFYLHPYQTILVCVTPKKDAGIMTWEMTAYLGSYLKKYK